MKKVAIFLALFLTFSLFAENVKVAFGLALPPYVISKANAGMEYDIIFASLARKGHKMSPVYVPFSTVPDKVADGSVDAAATVSPSSGLENVFYSNSHVTYQNVAISLKSKDLSISSVENLKDLSILAFASAKKYLGEEFKAMADGNSRYDEADEQDKQIQMLFNGTYDVIVADINIFKFFSQKAKISGFMDKVSIHEIFPKTNYQVAFKSEAVKDDFNKGLEELRSSGAYDKIIKKYVK